jgi:hypothetical protein
MQLRAPNTAARSVRKTRLHRAPAIDEPNSAKRKRIFRPYPDAQFAERFQGIRHQTLAAGFVDGRYRAVGNGDAHSALARRDRRGQTRRTATYHENVPLEHSSSTPSST